MTTDDRTSTNEKRDHGATMATVLTFPTPSIFDILERSVQEQRDATQALRARIARVDDLLAREEFSKIVELCTRYIAELETQVAEAKSRNEITRQINEMFQ